VPDAAASVIVTVRNEERNLPLLLESLVRQEGLREVIVVDSESTDQTAAAAEAFRARLPGLNVIRQRCTRGEGRNIGARVATGELFVFTDGDCIADAGWIEHLIANWHQANDRVLAGRTVLTGYWAFRNLHRVELPHRGQDTTWPSCNLAYPASLFAQLGGFDATFVTAEDIDLNYRAVAAGAAIVHVPEAVVYARARESIAGFLRQAYWNGYGRKQLTRKHGSLWHEYSFSRLLRPHGGVVWGTLRLGAGLVGYLSAKLGRRPPR
jgi:glycosyltransferase involved in cell wall biosynthesis